MYQSGQSQSVDGGLPSKTPVSLLQELCMRRGISPKYDLLQIEGPVHEPTFVYRVTVGEYAANGSGQTKKKAKHAAAKAVLDIIIRGGSGSQGQSGSAPELSSQIVSPYDDGIPGNPVGALQELCMSRRWPPPTYELSAEEGFPHERTFSICCTIGNHKEIGAGKSKKLSKRQAANKMLLKLKDQPVDNLPMNVLADDDDEVNKDSAYPVAEGSGSCPSLRKACTKAPFSILHPKRVCNHLSDALNSSSYQVCENCFKYVLEAKNKGFKTSGTFQTNSFQDPNVNEDSKGKIFSGESENVMFNPVIDIQNHFKRNDNVNCCDYTKSELGKLEEMFDKIVVTSLIAQSKQELIENNHAVETETYDSVTSTDRFLKMESNDVEMKDKELYEFTSITDGVENEDVNVNNGIGSSTYQTIESNDPSQNIATPRIIKGILHNFNFENVESRSEPNMHLFTSSDH